MSMIVPTTINYNLEEFPFHHIVSDMMDVHNLMFLHETTNEIILENPLPGFDQNTTFHRKFYDSNKDFLEVYRRFVKFMIRFYYDREPMLFQSVPTFRVHLPNSKAVGGSTHKDSDYGHPPGEINWIVSLTPMMSTNSLFTESSPGLRDFSFIDLKLGQAFVFDGNQCEHGNVNNKTGFTRVSFDFRLLPISKYDENYNKQSVANQTKFTIGNYYENA